MNLLSNDDQYPRGVINASASIRGVAIVEFSFIVFIFIVLLLGLIDFSRFLAVQAVLTKGAQDGLNIAQKTPNFSTDIRTPISGGLDCTCTIDGYFANLDCSPAATNLISCTGSLPASRLKECRDYYSAYCRVISAAQRLPLNSLVTSFNSPSSAQFHSFNVGAPMATGGSNAAVNVAIMRPGDQLTDATANRVINHPIVCAPSAGCPIELSPGDNLNKVLENQPITVQLEAEVITITPFLGALTAKGQATGYREIVKRGSFPTGPGTTVPTTVTTTTTVPAPTTSTTSTSTTSTSTTSTSTTTTSTTSTSTTTTSTSTTSTSTTSTSITTTSTTTTTTSTSSSTSTSTTSTSTTTTSTTTTSTSTTSTSTTSTSVTTTSTTVSSTSTLTTTSTSLTTTTASQPVTTTTLPCPPSNPSLIAQCDAIGGDWEITRNGNCACVPPGG